VSWSPIFEGLYFRDEPIVKALLCQTRGAKRRACGNCQDQGSFFWPFVLRAKLVSNSYANYIRSNAPNIATGLLDTIWTPTRSTTIHHRPRKFRQRDGPTVTSIVDRKPTVCASFHPPPPRPREHRCGVHTTCTWRRTAHLTASATRTSWLGINAESRPRQPCRKRQALRAFLQQRTPFCKRLIIMSHYGLCDSCSKIDFLSLVYELEGRRGSANGDERSVRGDNPMPFGEDVVDGDSSPDLVSDSSIPLAEDAVNAEIASVDVRDKPRLCRWMRAIGTLPSLVRNWRVVTYVVPITDSGD
jgi:hypothetical protein